MEQGTTRFAFCYPRVEQITPANGFGYTLSLGPDQSLTGKSFIVRSTQGSISGAVFSDGNGDKVQDNGELGLGGWTVYIDLDNSGVLKVADPKAITDTVGHYSFSNLNADAYIIRVIRPTGWAQTTPANGFGQHITLSAGQTITGLLF